MQFTPTADELKTSPLANFPLSQGVPETLSVENAAPPKIPEGITAEKLLPSQVMDPVPVAPEEVLKVAAPPCVGTDVGKDVQFTPTADELKTSPLANFPLAQGVLETLSDENAAPPKIPEGITAEKLLPSQVMDPVPVAPEEVVKVAAPPCVGTDDPNAEITSHVTEILPAEIDKPLANLFDEQVGLSESEFV